MGAAGQQLVRLAADDAHQAILARPGADGGLYFTERTCAGQRRQSGFPRAGANNVFNRDAHKSLALASTPHIFVTGFTYLTPRWGTNKFVRNVLGDWTLGATLRYASGQVIGAPGSNNNLGSLIFQGTRMNRVPGQPLFLKDPNCGCIDPRQDLALNPAAWADAPPGQFGFSPGFYSDYRWQRHVSENMSLGRRFTIKERMKFDIRAEFFNVFNRLYLPAPGG